LKVALLAAGKGNRLRPATDSIPKPLLPIACSTLLDHNLALLNSPEVYVVVCYMKELFLGYRSKYGVNLVDQGEPLGTGHAVLKLEDSVKEDLLLLYSDIYIPPGFLEIFLSERDKYDHLVAVAPVERPWEFGVIEAEGNLLKRIVEKPRRGEEPSNLVVAGVFLLSQSIFDILRGLGPSPRGEIELTSAITEAVERGERVGIVRMSPWVDAGRREDFLLAQELLLNDMISGLRRVPEGFRVEGSLIIGRNAEMNGNFDGPCCIDGKLIDSKVAKAYIQQSEVIGSTIRNSIVMSGSLINRSSIESSIISKGSSVINSKLLNSINASGTSIEGCEVDNDLIWESRSCST
jgi:NDP-sugar pyrophosphorylase family protein